MKIFITGSNSGVGLAVKNLLSPTYNITASTRNELDLGDFESIDNLDLSEYDIVINCAGANAGAYLGWQNNSWKNQQNQVDVNFTSALLLAKQYVKQRTQGQFVFITSSNIEDPRSVNIFYTASKAALRYSMQILRREYPGIIFTEICPGKIQTNMLKQNYQGTMSESDIKNIYAETACLSADQVATAIDSAITHKLTQITLVPHD